MAAKKDAKAGTAAAGKEEPRSKKRRRRDMPAPTASSSSASAPMRDKAQDELRQKLECAVCCHMMFPPIRQCTEGHNMCDKCCEVIMEGPTEHQKCPTCRLVLRRPVARSRNLEDWAIQANPEVECDFKDCGERFRYAAFGEHVQSCVGRTVTCPVTGCEWRGKPADLGQHLAAAQEGGHGFHRVDAPYSKRRVSFVVLTFEGRRALGTADAWKPARQLIAVKEPGKVPKVRATFCAALWKPEGERSPLLVAIQQLRRACDFGSGHWGAELILVQGRHAVRVAAPASDLDSSSDVWRRRTQEECRGPLLVVPPDALPRFNEASGTGADEPKQKYSITVKLWSEWPSEERQGIELPEDVFIPLQDEAEIIQEDEESESEDDDSDSDSDSDSESYSDDDEEEIDQALDQELDRHRRRRMSG